MVRRWFSVMGLLLVLVGAQEAHASGPAKFQVQNKAVGHVLRTSGLKLYANLRVDCKREKVNRYACAVRLTAQGNLSLQRCSLDVRVLYDPKPRTRTVGRSCRKLDHPFLSVKAAAKAARRLVDKDLGVLAGGSYWRVSETKYQYQFFWLRDEGSCIQEVRVALIDGRVLGSTGGAVCASSAPWPSSD